MLVHDGQAAGGDAARAHQAAQARQEASPLPPAGRALGDGRTTWTTGRPRGPGGRPRSRSAGPRVSPSDIRRARGAGASSRPGVRLTLTQALAPRSARPPAGPRQARGLVKPLRTVLYYHRPAVSDLYAPECGHRAPRGSPSSSGPTFSHEIVHTRRVRPSRGPHAPDIAGEHPVDNISASGTTSWPSWPTRSRTVQPASARRRPRMAGRRVRKRSHAVSRGSSTPGGVVGDSLQRYTQQPAAPDPRKWNRAPGLHVKPDEVATRRTGQKPR